MLKRLSILSPKFAIIRHGSFKNVTLINPPTAPVLCTPNCAATKPFLVELEADKKYSFCACGFSAKQPFCDGTHKEEGRTLLRPLRFTVDKSDKYYLCGCKQSKTLPLCDATHKKIDQTPNDVKAA